MSLAFGVVMAAAVGLSFVRTAPAAARAAAWVVVLGFLAVALDPREVAFFECAPRTGQVVLDGADATEVRSEALAAAAAAGPRSRDLTLTWSGRLGDAVGTGPLGAVAQLPFAALPLQPEAIQVRALGEASVGRPVSLRLEAPPLAEPVDAELSVHFGTGEVLRQQVRLGVSPPPEVPFTAALAGLHRVELAITVAGHRLVCSGGLDVVAAPRVLVLEPSGVAAAALRAQGVAVDEARSLPDDWRTRRALVIGQSLPVDAQQAIVAAVIDGMGAFVLAPGFAGQEEPLRALLPVRPLPPAPDGNGAGAGPGEPADPRVAPPGEPSPPPPRDERPPRGDSTGASPVASEPIEVDKRAIAMVLVVDRSGSMGNTLPNGHTKMSYAKTSALRTAMALGEGDQVAIVTFGDKDAGRVELPMTPATDLAAVRAGVTALAHAPERTFLLAGLRLANDLLAATKAAVKHVVVVTDGEFDPSESMALRSLANRMRTQGKQTVSMVSIVDRFTAPEFRREAELLTRDGGGQFLPIDDPSSVPVLVSAEVTRALQRVGREPRDASRNEPTPPDEPRPQPKPPEPEPPRPDPSPAPPAPQRLVVRAVAESTLLLPRPDDAWPTLGAAVAGTAPLDAHVLLVAGDQGWPLLAFGNRGLGRVGAFAADLFGPAGLEFRTSDSFPARLAAWVQSVLPAQAVRLPEALLHEYKLQPPAPTPDDVARLLAMTGTAPVLAGASGSAPLPSIARSVVSLAGPWALWLVLSLVGLALCERYAGLWAWRRGAGPQ
ncbi:MAG TPA: vWA domain-containing protein [Planctomycetota bacterium]|nr:vWA domain-containing protein [Planctomycetota bacterium]